MITPNDHAKAAQYCADNPEPAPRPKREYILRKSENGQLWEVWERDGARLAYSYNKREMELLLRSLKGLGRWDK